MVLLWMARNRRWATAGVPLRSAQISARAHMACARRQSRSIVGSVRDPHAPRTAAGFDRIALEARLSRLGSEAAILGHDAISVEPFVIKCPPSSRTANGCRKSSE